MLDISYVAANSKLNGFCLCTIRLTRQDFLKLELDLIIMVVALYTGILTRGARCLTLSRTILQTMYFVLRPISTRSPRSNSIFNLQRYL